MSKNLKDIKLIKSSLQDFSLAMMSSDYSTLNEVAISDFFGSQERTSSETEVLSDYEHKKIQYVWEEFFKNNNYELIKQVSYGYLKEIPPRMVEVEVSPNVFKKIYKDATLFYKKKDILLSVEIRITPRGGYVYVINSTEKDSMVFQEMKAFASEKNLYKGKKINADCRFLNLDNISWDDIILPDGVSETIRGNIDNIFSLREKFKKHGLSVKRGVILHGDPGMGKTKICKALAKDAPYSVLYALPSDFHPQKGGIRRICNMAKDLAPCLLIIEDIDWIAQNRLHGDASFVMELMNQLDGLESFGDIITLGTTNALANLEEAVKNRPGRFDRVIEIAKPSEECRIKMINRFTSKFILDKTVNVSKLAQALDGLSGAHVNDLCLTAATFAVRDDSLEGEKLLLLKKHFDESIKEIKDKNYSSYMQMQNRNKGFGFSQEEYLGLDSYHSDIDDNNY